MSAAQLGQILWQVRRLAAGDEFADASDGQLLECFRVRRDEAAFAALLRRHGPMVLGVARRVLRQEQDAEDVCQAAFLLLARKAGAIRKGESVGSWLHGVAYRLAVEVKGRGARRQAHEGRAGAMRHQQTKGEGTWQELEEVLDQALARLPKKYREAVVLCSLEGKTQEESARQLGCPLGTVRSRLARGRERLRKELVARGVTLSAGALAIFLAASAAPAAIPAARQVLTGSVSPRVAALVDAVAEALAMTKAKAVVAWVVALGIVGAGAGVCARQALSAKPPAAAEQEGARRGPDAGAERDRADAFGDPLPEGARARLGTVRFRHTDMVSCAVFSGDGKALIAGDRGGGLVFWDAATGKELRFSRNAIKLSRNPLLQQPLAQDASRMDHVRVFLRPALLATWLNSPLTLRVHDQARQRGARWRGR